MNKHLGLHLSRLEALVEALPGYVSWLDSKLQYLKVNQRLADAQGMKPEDFIGRKVGFSSDSKEFVEFVNRVFKAGPNKIVQTEFQAIQNTSPQDDRWVYLVGYCFNEGAEAVIVGLDITDLKEKESLIHVLEERAKNSARLSAIGEVAAGIAHEIKNPLAALLGRIIISKDKLKSDESSRIDFVLEQLEKMEAISKRIDTIIKGLGKLSRNSADDQLEEAFLTDLIDEVVEVCREKIRTSRVTVDTSGLSKDLCLRCRPAQISQVFLNLITNAIDAVSEKNTKWIRIEARTAQDKIEIDFIDSGTGIPSSLKSRLLEAFFTTKPLGQGTGLGLSISKGIIEDHDGKLEITESSEGNTCFRVTLPHKKTA